MSLQRSHNLAISSVPLQHLLNALPCQQCTNPAPSPAAGWCNPWLVLVMCKWVEVALT